MAPNFKYLNVRQQLLAEAEKTANYRLPSERELCRQFNVSRNTAKKALNSLYDDKLVVRKVGCGTFLVASKVKSTVSVILPWGGQQISDFFEEQVNNFSKQNASVELKLVKVKPGEIIRQAASIQGAKVVCVPNVGYLADYGMLAPLDKLAGFQEMSQAINSQYIDWFQFGSSQRHCYSVPLFLGVNMCVINRRLAGKLGLDGQNGPATFDEMFSWLQCVDDYNKAQGETLLYGTHMASTASRFSSPPLAFYLTLSNGESFIKQDNGSVTFDFACGRDWINLFKQVRRYKSIYYGQSQPHCSITGETLFNYSVGSWAIQELRDYGRLDEVSFTGFPAAMGGEPSFSDSSKISLAIIEDGKPEHPARQAAWEFIRFLTEDVGPQRQIGRYFTAINKEVFQEQVRDANMYPFIQSLATSVMRSDHPVQHSINKIVRKYFNDAVYGQLATDDAVERIIEMGNLQIEIESERDQGWHFAD